MAPSQRVHLSGSDVAEIVSTVDRLTSATGVECAISGRAALGIILLRFAGDPAAHAPTIVEIRRAATAGGGSAVVVSSSTDGAMTPADRWGPIGDAEPVMRAVKARFDPHHILNATLAPWD